MLYEKKEKKREGERKWKLVGMKKKKKKRTVGDAFDGVINNIGELVIA